jgi:serine/threonine-protein kinase
MSFPAADGTVDELVGTRFGAYEVDSLIGVGGMGKVYKAVGPDGTEVALKVVKPKFARDEIFMRRFKREARIARTVCNPHVVPVLESGEHGGIPYLVEQFIEGGSLADKLKLEQRLDVQTTVRICAQVAEGLAALAGAGMVHRDVKPGNILLDDDGTAYLTDFGLAKDCQGSVLTQPGQALGSLDYMAPEQIRGEVVGPATDTYALGCVMFECLHGRPPFADRQGMRVLWAHLQEEPPDPGRSDVSSEFVAALKAALRKEPEERPGSSIDYARSLSQAAGVSVAV